LQLVLVLAHEFVDERDNPERDLVHRQFLVAGAQRAALLVPPHHAFDAVAPAVRGPGKGVFAGLVVPAGNHRPNMMARSPAAQGWGTVAFLPSPLLGPARMARPAWALGAQ
jgi:hypothetical protein